MKLPFLCVAILAAALAGSSVRTALASQAYVSDAGPGGAVSLFDYTEGPAAKTYATRSTWTTRIGHRDGGNGSTVARLSISGLTL
jgi:hypothetical protein